MRKPDLHSDRKSQHFSRKGTSSEYLSYLPATPTRLRRSCTVSEEGGRSKISVSVTPPRPPPRPRTASPPSRKSDAISLRLSKLHLATSKDTSPRVHTRRPPGLSEFFLGITEGLEEASTACIAETAVAAIANEIGIDVLGGPDEDEHAASLVDHDALLRWRPAVLAEEMSSERGLDGDAVLDPLIQQTIDELLAMMQDDGEDGFEEGYRLEEKSCGFEGSLDKAPSGDEWSLGGSLFP